ncbi:MAG: DUF748 domain-containing protein [Candidatus Methylacidiphilales bacterium]
MQFKKWSKIYKTILGITAIIILLAIAIIVFISPITKYLIEKYDEKYTGRQITVDWVYVNPFTGYLLFNNLTIYELKSDSVFISSDELIADFSVYKIFNKNYEITELTFDKPKFTVIQNQTEFNFNSIIDKFVSKEKTDTTEEPVHFSLLNLNINDGVFYYKDSRIPINYFIKKVNISSEGYSWNIDSIETKFTFESGIKTGVAKGDFSINLKNLNYRLAAVVNKFDLQIIDQYLNALTNYGKFSATLDADIKAFGNFSSGENINLKGLLAINEFHFGKNPKEDYASFKKLVVAINELSPKNKKYNFDSIYLNKPYFKYERYDSLDNIQTIFGGKGSNIKSAKANTAQFNLIFEIADYVKILAKNFFRSDYKINRVAIYNGNLKYNDYALSEKFSVGLSPFSFYADSIDKKHLRVNASISSGLKPFGNANIKLSVNPKDSTDFDLNYEFKNIPITMFNPYIISYTSYPLDRGTIEIIGNWRVRNGIINSRNHLLVIDPRHSKRVKNKGNKWIPMWLVMAFARERGNVIDYQIPITGNLNKPNFKYRDIIIDIITNILVKPITSPYIFEIKNIETKIEKALTIKWPTRVSVFDRKQKKFTSKMVEFLKQNPNAIIQIYPQHYNLKEKEYILFFEAKKKYYTATKHISAKSLNDFDSTCIERMSIKDKDFVKYLNSKTKDKMLFTIQEKCSKLVGNSTVNLKFKQLNAERANVFMQYFKDEQVEKQIQILKRKTVIPYNGFSFYKIVYKEEFPNALVKAYKKLEDLNDEEPRIQFKEIREKMMIPFNF